MEIIVILILIAIAAAAEAFIYSKKGAEQLSYRAHTDNAEVFEGETLTLTEELSNSKALPLPFVKTEIIAPACLNFGVKAAVSKEGFCCIPSVFSLKGREKCKRVRRVKCLCRGVFEIGASSLYGGDLFGLAEFTAAANANEKVTVLPVPLSAEDFEADNKQLYGDILTKRFICDDPFLVKGVHEYSGREPMNSIAWNATAKAGKIMALDRDFSTCSKMLILLNFQRRDDIIAPASNEACEILIKAAAFALQRAEELGAEFALSINLPENENVTVGSGAGFRLEQLRRLAAVKADCRLSVGDFLRNQAVESFTDTVLITPTLSPDTAGFLKDLQGCGKGVCAYALHNDANADFCAQIIRRVKEEA